MRRLHISFDDQMLEDMTKFTNNKSEFIRQAIIEKIERRNDTNGKNFTKIIYKIEELENRIMHNEKMIFLLNETIQKQQELLLETYKVLTSTKYYVIENFGLENAESIKNEISEAVENKLNEIINKINL
ncbi:MAG: hypothetical protein ACK5Z5_02160 [Neisseriaceae bacterium]|jgi:metal-responsive CopG/Arc/MetJ family transcriptional regulator